MYIIQKTNISTDTLYQVIQYFLLKLFSLNYYYYKVFHYAIYKYLIIIVGNYI